MQVETAMRALLCGLLGGLLVAPVPAEAELYRFVDAAGAVHFSDNPVDRHFERVVLTPVGLRVRGSGPSSRRRPPRVSRYDRLILRLGQSHEVSPALVKAVIAAESNFNPRAVSKKGAQGLMQLMPQTARELGVENAFEPEQNVSGGTRYLRQMLTRYGDVSRALAAYNAGPEAVDRYRGIPPYQETQAYVDRVLTYYATYNEALTR
jgi:soluble lytic murein transglycosylase